MDDEDDFQDCWATVRSQKPRPPQPWGEVLAAHVWKEPIVVINGSLEARERALAEVQYSLAQTVVQKPCLMLHSPHVSISKSWLDSDSGVKHTLMAVFKDYERVNQRPPVVYDTVDGCQGTVPALLHDTLYDAKASRATWTVEAGRQFLHEFWDTDGAGRRLRIIERLEDWLGLGNVDVENDLCIARLMNFLYLANKVKTISNIHLAFDCLDQGNNTELATIETMLKLIRDRDDLFGCFGLVLGWSGEDKMLNRLNQFAPVCEAALQNSLTVH